MLHLSQGAKALTHFVLLSVCLAVALPIILVVLASFKSPSELYSGIPWPLKPTLANYVEVFNVLPFATYLWNSIATTGIRVFGQIILALLAAYAFARFTFKCREVLFGLVLAGMLIPHQLTFLPVYLTISRLGWFDTWAALIVPNLAMPLGVFMLRQHLMSFPTALYDAATMDGATELRILWSVVLPNLKPVLSALTIILFIDCWNEYFWPLLVTESSNAMTVQIGVRRFLTADQGDDIGALMAAATLVSLPAFVVFALFQRQIVQTFASSGIKG